MIKEYGIEAEFTKFLCENDRGVKNRVPLDKMPEIGEIVFSRYHGNGIVVGFRNEHIAVNFNGKVFLCLMKYLWKGDK